jgi:hypothetical protein
VGSVPLDRLTIGLQAQSLIVCFLFSLLLLFHVLILRVPASECTPICPLRNALQFATINYVMVLAASCCERLINGYCKKNRRVRVPHAKATPTIHIHTRYESQQQSPTAHPLFRSTTLATLSSSPVSPSAPPLSSPPVFPPSRAPCPSPRSTTSRLSSGQAAAVSVDARRGSRAPWSRHLRLP